jgi:hypothetical protein
MKTLKLFNGKLNVTINNKRQSIMLWEFFMLKRYKAIKIDGMEIRHVGQNNNKIACDVITDNEIIYFSCTYTGMHIELAALTYGDILSEYAAGEVSAIDEAYLYTTVNVNDRSVPAKLPIDITRNLAFVVDGYTNPEILAINHDKGDYDVYTYIMKFKGIEKRIVYSLNLDAPLDSTVCEMIN